MGFEHNAVTGALTRPVFSDIPPPHIGGRRKKKPFPYGRLLDIVREHPGQPAIIARFTKGPRKTTWNQARYQKDRTRKWLDENCPLEEWRLSIRTTMDTWGDRELWVMYVGPWSTEEMELDRKRRKEAQEINFGLSERRKAERAAKDRMAEIQSANRQSGPFPRA